MPFLAPIAGVIGAVASAGASVIGGIAAGNAQKQAADYNAQVQQNNAITAQRNATIASEMGEQQAQQRGMQTAQNVGKAKAVFGAAGIDPLTGSASDTESGIESAGLTDVQTIQSNAARQAWGYQTQASNFQAQAGLDIMQGQNEQESSFLSGGSSGLNDWLKFGNVGSSNQGSTNLASNTV